MSVVSFSEGSRPTSANESWLIFVATDVNEIQRNFLANHLRKIWYAISRNEPPYSARE